ncbi:MAG: penicillin-insensitive murein endopeptidase [Myxococcota bacterium]
MGKKKRRRNAAARRKHKRPAASSAPAEFEADPLASEDEPEAIEAAADEAETDVDDDASPSPAEESVAPAKPSSAVLVPPATVPMPTGPSTPTVPRSMRLALGASIGAALLSTSVALFAVLRGGPTEPAGTRDAAAPASVADADPAPPSSKPSAPESDVIPAATSPEAAVASPTAPDPSEGPWPDLRLDALPEPGAAPASMGQSIGSPRDGALLSPKRLPNGRDYLIKNENTAWATDNTVAHLTAALASLRKKHPTMPRVVIGDLSTRRGGPLSGHTSHQSGRDVDVGLVHRGRGEDIPNDFIEGTRESLDRRVTFDLIAALAATRDEPTGVELIVLDYGLQRQLRRAAAARGIPEAELEALFQYPHGPDSRHGLIRHKPAHRDHLHVRFRCPEDDAFCRSPLIGFAGMEAADPAAGL